MIASLLAGALYSFAWYQAWSSRHSVGHSSAPIHDKSSLLPWALGGAIAAHIFYTHTALFTQSEQQLSLPYVINVISLIIVLVVAGASLRLPLARLLILVLPLAIISLLVAAIVGPGQSKAEPLDPPLLTHILISLAAYSALMLAACQSILLAVLERQLKSAQQTSTHWLPPLETMEQLLIAMLWIGFALLTASIASGFFFLDDMFAQQVAHHIVITSLSWLVYVTFLVGRYMFGWRGLTAVRWTLVAFSLLVIGYLGSKLVLEYILAG